ncbi:hypothetical protein ACIBKY_53475 [Nonomuraea sp. NPDC050394]|uniref:hypothetical protein n=1 Tax=Nonomuraea sp. NPDC050394 TaxID=3364363 RepID=UPI0037AA691E
MSTPEQRSTIARIAAHTRWAREEDRVRATAKARSNSPASIEYFLRDVDARLPYAERLKRAESAKSAYWQRRARLMREAKKAKAAAKKAA